MSYLRLENMISFKQFNLQFDNVFIKGNINHAYFFLGKAQTAAVKRDAEIGVAQVCDYKMHQV